MKKGLTDSECHQIVRRYWSLVSQTAEFRYRICWHGARELFRARGYDPLGIIQAGCDPGDDVRGWFVMSDGLVLSCDFREDPVTRQATAIPAWEPLECSTTDEDDEALALQIQQDPRLKAAFDLAVQAFFEFHWAERDHPLPPTSSQ